MWSKINKLIDEGKLFQNASFFYEFSKLFKLRSFEKTSYSFMQCYFATVVDTQNFLELDYTSISKILASSNLNTDSELEVFFAAEKWLCHNIRERREFAKSTLLKARLFLLSDHVLKYLLNKPSNVLLSDERVEILNKVINERDGLKEVNPKASSTHRCCDQQIFSVLTFGGYNYALKKTLESARHFKGNSLKTSAVIPPMPRRRVDAEAVFVKGEIYVLGGCEDFMNGSKRTLSVDKYSPATKCWDASVARMPDERKWFAACAFMGDVYLMGGRFENFQVVGPSLRLDASSREIRPIAGMDQARYLAACAVYAGNIVVSGGVGPHPNLKSVERYDPVADEWTPMPDMVEARSCHSMVVVRGKLFVTGSNRCNNRNLQVFDETSNRFAILKTRNYLKPNKALAIGGEIFIFHHNTAHVTVYNVDKNEWSKIDFVATNEVSYYSCVKVPLF